MPSAEFWTLLGFDEGWDNETDYGKLEEWCTIYNRLMRLWWQLHRGVRGLILIAICAVISFSIGTSGYLNLVTLGIVSIITFLFIFTESVHRSSKP